MRPALLLLEFDSIAVGIEVGDAMVKRAPLLTLHAGTVHPGKYLVMAGGEVADVEEAWIAGRSTASGFEVDEVFLPEVDPQVVSSLTGGPCGAAPHLRLHLVEILRRRGVAGREFFPGMCA